MTIGALWSGHPQSGVSDRRAGCRVKRASEINMVLAFLLLVFVLIVGPTGDIIASFVGSLGAYAQNLPALSQPFGRTDANFSQGWTAFWFAGA